MSSPFSIVGQDGPGDSQNTVGHGCCPWLPPWDWKRVPILEDIMHLDMASEEPGWAWPEDWLAFMITEGAMKFSKGRKKPIFLHSNAAYGLQQWPAWHTSAEGTVVAHIPWQEPQLSNFVRGPLNKRKTMPVTRNLATYPGLVKSRITEENLELALC